LTLNGITDKLLKRWCPELLVLFAEHKIQPAQFTLDWLYTGFTRGFSPKIYRLIWDYHFLFGGYYFLSSIVVLFRYFQEEAAKEDKTSNFLRLTLNRFSPKKFTKLTLENQVQASEFQEVLEGELERRRRNRQR